MKKLLFLFLILLLGSCASTNWIPSVSSTEVYTNVSNVQFTPYGISYTATRPVNNFNTSISDTSQIHKNKR